MHPLIDELVPISQVPATVVYLQNGLPYSLRIISLALRIMVAVALKTIGSKKQSIPDFTFSPPKSLLESEAVTLSELISEVVRHEVSAFHERQESRQFFRALTVREIEQGKKAGKIESGASALPVTKIDPEQAIATALQAFEDGLYFCVVDQTQKRSLADIIDLKPDSRLTFIRLVALAGG